METTNSSKREDEGDMSREKGDYHILKYNVGSPWRLRDIT